MKKGKEGLKRVQKGRVNISTKLSVDRGIILIQVGCFLISGVVGATKLERSVACSRYQRFRIGIEFNSFLFEKEC